VVVSLQRTAGNTTTSRLLTRWRRTLARTLNDGHDLSSPRFAGNIALEAVFDGERDIRRPAQSADVRILQQALVDLGHPLPVHGVDGKFGPETETAVKAFQSARGVPDSGRLDAATMDALDRAFLTHSPDRGLAQAPGATAPPAPHTEYAPGTAPAALTAGTRTITAAEDAAVEAALNPTPTVDPVTGLPPVFRPTLSGGRVYETRIEARLNARLTAEFTAIAAGRRAQRAAPGGLHAWAEIHAVADQAKASVDAVFGVWARRPALRSGTNLFDRWERQEALIGAMDPAQKRAIAVWRVEKAFRVDEDIRTINTEHGVRRDRPAEAAIIDTVKNRIAAAREADLLELHRAWPGSANPATGEIFLQRFKAPDTAGRRAFMWETFQTLIHEYIHTLAHSRYRGWMDDPATPPEKSHTLREGMTDYLTKVVWEGVNQAAVRAAVEGPYHDPAAALAVPALTTYDEAANAERAVGIVGTRNAYAAYFLGEIEKLGGP
jgi:peptidoglycan hydrolase-like protein with peptidoglycan-binding domain